MRPVPIVPLFISKANTLAQITYVALLLADLGLGLPLEPATSLLVWVVAALTVASAAAYLQGWLRYMQS